MPVITEYSETEDNTKVQVYSCPAVYVTPTTEIQEFLKIKRKEAVKEQEYFLSLQKEFGKEKEYFKFFKEESRYWLKIQRACTLHLPWFGGEGGVVRPKHWPIDLVNQLDRVSNWIILGEDHEQTRTNLQTVQES